MIERKTERTVLDLLIDLDFWLKMYRDKFSHRPLKNKTIGKTHLLKEYLHWVFWSNHDVTFPKVYDVVKWTIFLIKESCEDFVCGENKTKDQNIDFVEKNINIYVTRLMEILSPLYSIAVNPFNSEKEIDKALDCNHNLLQVLLESNVHTSFTKATRKKLVPNNTNILKNIFYNYLLF